MDDYFLYKRIKTFKNIQFGGIKKIYKRDDFERYFRGFSHTS